MGDFRRQPSKVWWSTYEDENLSMYSSFLGWGKGVDLSGTFGEGYNNNNNSMNSTKNNLNLSKCEKTDANLDKSTSGFPKNDQTTQDLKEKDDGEADRETERKSLESDRGSSSSPSQGSHKSQDSGFSDSEIQNNGASLSPQCSPEMSKARLSCIKCQSRDESVSSANEAETLSQKEKAYNEAVASYRKLKTSVKTTPQYKLVEFDPDVFREPEKKCLETAFDGSYAEENLEKGKKSADCDGKTGKPVSDSVSPRRNTERKPVKSQPKKRDKINHIQNQLETSLKLPKKINLTQNLKISNIFHGKPEVKNQRTPTSLKPKAKSTECITPFKPLAVVYSNGTLPKKISSSSLDNEGFKVPKLPAEKATNHLYDLTDIEGLPISCSTPKSSKFGGRDSPGVPAAARATEKRTATKTTFATVRKLKGLSDKKLRGSKTLLTSFNRCSSSGSFFNKAKVQIDTESAVKHWISELETMYEAEVMTTLQSKSLAVDLTRQVTSMADTTSYTVRKLHQKTKVISLEFHRLCRQNKSKPDKHLVPLVQSLVGHVTEFINEYVPKPSPVTANDQRTADKNQKIESGTKKVEVEEEANDSHEMITDFRTPEPETVEMKAETPRPKSKEEEVLNICENLRRLIVQNPSGDFEKIEGEVANLGEKFREVVDGLLESHIQALVGVLEEPRTELALRTALSALTTLGLEGNQLGIVVSKCGGIRALLAICLEARATAVRVSALRALATVCCVADTIRQFEQAGGVEIVADILADEKRSEAELSEAAAVIAQVTAPWVQDNHSVEGLSQFLHSLVKSLTRIVNRYKSCETLLLGAAALANLTFMEPRTVWPLLECETAKILLSAVRRQGSKVSVFIQEQVATIIANMSSVPECRKHLAEQRAVVALLCFLEIPHSPVQSAPEVAAAERVLQKSAIALSRLCSDTVVAKQVVELQGVTRLVRLCKEERERNHSDGVLVACLAALRKIVANCGTEALEELNAMELVEPRLLDSFLLYSSKQESYV